MADTMQFDLVSPERSLASLQATAVQLPGADGDLTAMPNHAPTITTLRPGIVRVESPEGNAEFVVTGGFAEVTAAGTSVLAERALPVSEVTQDILDGFVSDAAAASSNATAENLDELAKRTVDIAAMASDLGLSVKG
ncbi:ATP synthase F1 subcomplex epsilon subunit [Aliiroseovarius halocynthiae]|uniref:ATP synthase epsilon chain n=1 Tax=Aliiroseovarius halocynthiae TaxID=985055 RepID=A0A545SYJ9_9RHOB|nr:F0F1 ATP synthase subunit epsilon [Aliiroseovarius halocynthiae]TQV70045.1 F0F1 ATP synthase subunit epsilon [Aliiroseovarius halocynthiae]SMR70715.1 ATP synthase F1 subcomplex epsilon subunit [Aliiroseovarius halocynthiae]